MLLTLSVVKACNERRNEKKKLYVTFKFYARELEKNCEFDLLTQAHLCPLTSHEI